MRTHLARAAQILKRAGVAAPEVDARLIAAHLLEVAPTEVTFAAVPEGFPQAFDEAVARRAAREPLQHILGSAPFGPLELEVGPGVFIPRPETELLADWAVRMLIDGSASHHPTVVDLGTGSGALAIYIAHHVPNADVYAVERSAQAREYAERNVARFAPSISIVPGDMTDPNLLSDLDGRVDLVVSNPPYVPETPELEAEVYADPAEAVFSGADGMDAIRGLLPVARRLLKPGGALGVEHDDTTSDAVHNAVRATGGFGGIEARTDLTGRARFVTASRVEDHV
ncbi:peptide chain release factor N(5)-glutamine methyltransferase [Corynebacterium sp. Marseille-P4321]|uniref:peptide chain release factor N(5)-glutamine methyltransferase n=1 Tax=Corynebacterium sp. Marseille-P4321 TaxID=2736603 RepID=UPI00158CCB82|nr:peptide chain release factor N(5)-glutamine methyltransferase [Corynebacterium sp. Marseille-P4321]